eukprot:c20779_g4_i1.p1 GENE.c20779_g4_i1~~c20779_g4_i1.p1  ORF type:complete len:126 (+),score=15.11 c20779_g4_i1:124-501(+)
MKMVDSKSSRPTRSVEFESSTNSFFLPLGPSSWQIIANLLSPVSVEHDGKVTSTSDCFVKTSSSLELICDLPFGGRTKNVAPNDSVSILLCEFQEATNQGQKKRSTYLACYCFIELESTPEKRLK